MRHHANWVKPACQALQNGQDVVLVSVLLTKGSTPCMAGDKLLVADGCIIYGSIGGGNLEYQTIAQAKTVLADCAVHVEDISLAVKVGQCCGGLVTLSYEPLLASTPPDWLDVLSRIATDTTSDAVLVSVLCASANHPTGLQSGDRFVITDAAAQPIHHRSLTVRPLRQYAHDLLTQPQSSIAVCRYHHYEGEVRCVDGVGRAGQRERQRAGSSSKKPPETELLIAFETICTSDCQSLVLFGAGHISRELVALLCKLPVAVFCVDDRADEMHLLEQKVVEQQQLNPHGQLWQPHFLRMDFMASFQYCPEQAYYLVITYSHEIDYALCQHILLHRDYSYLGLIGSVTKGRRFRQRLVADGVDAAGVADLHCPIGTHFETFKSATVVAVAIIMMLLTHWDSSNHNTAR